MIQNFRSLLTDLELNGVDSSLLHLKVNNGKIGPCGSEPFFLEADFVVLSFPSFSVLGTTRFPHVVLSYSSTP